jgi:hypothetical protein
MFGFVQVARFAELLAINDGGVKLSVSTHNADFATLWHGGSFEIAL